MRPENSTIIGPCIHPADGAPGVALSLANGREVFWDGAIRALPTNWRAKQPAPGTEGTGIARMMTAAAR